jgi:hypothetical protein
MLFLPKHILLFLDVCPKNLNFGMWKNMEGRVCKTLYILFKYIAIGTQLLDIYHVSFIMLFALTNSSFFLELNGLKLI